MDINNENLKFKINPKRWRYVLELYGFSDEAFLSLLNQNKKRKILTFEEYNQIIEQKKDINIALLKKFDKIFEKGLTWYISKRELPEKRNSSIFFRKDSFNSDLNFESKKLIESYEELKFETQILCKQIGFQSKKILDEFSISDDPKNIAKKIRERFDDVEKNLIEKKIIKKASNDREYLQNLIRIIEQFNVFVFEFVDRKRKSEISFSGFFMLPNIIVIRRQQKYLRREIFTLLHEFAHYLLNIEEIDDNIESNTFENQSKVEKWCNNFTYEFLVRGFEQDFSKLKYASVENDFYKDEINHLIANTFLSEFALYTRLKIENKISKIDYDEIKEDIIRNIRRKDEEQKIIMARKKEKAKELGKKFIMRGPKEIRSNLFEEIVKINYFEGNIKENKLREYLKIKPNKSIEEVIY